MHCPLCAKQSFERLDSKEYECQNCGFNYFHNVAAAVCAIIRCEDEILFTYRAKDPGQGKLDLPGGFVDPNESLEQALHRELSEELGLAQCSLSYFCSYPNTYHYKNVDYFTTDICFVVTLLNKPLLTKDDDEILDVKWISLNDIKLDDLAFLSCQSMLRGYLSQED